MKVQYQVTIKCENGKYKPVSCLVEREQEHDTDFSRFAPIAKDIRSKGIQKILNKRGWATSDLMRYGYTDVYIRKYDRALIDAQNRERYAKLKAEKFASGEWKPTKRQQEEMEKSQ